MAVYKDIKDCLPQLVKIKGRSPQVEIKIECMACIKRQDFYWTTMTAKWYSFTSPMDSFAPESSFFWRIKEPEDSDL